MANFWDPYKPLIHLGSPIDPRSVPLPADLDAFEARHNFPPPLAYRDFLLAFGVGELSFGDPDVGVDSYILAVPGFCTNVLYLDPMAMTDRPTIAPRPDAKPDDLEAHLVKFCRIQDRGYFCWDPREVTNAESHDYAIYDADRDVERVADSFERLLLDVMLQGRLDPARPDLVLIEEPSEYESSRHLVRFAPRFAERYDVERYPRRR